jgi:hypothetical protein
MDAAALYPWAVYAHVLAFVAWLGGDIGVFWLGQSFRDRRYSLQERLTILKLLVTIDMAPRTAWAIMAPLSVTVTAIGGWWAAPPSLIAALWIVGAAWLYLVWDAHLHDQTPRAARARRIEFWLKIALTLFYLWLGAASLVTNLPLQEDWLAWKALLFGAIFAAAIMIDVAFKPVGPLLGALIAQGSSDATEIPLRRAMDRTRVWVFAVYALLAIIAALGVVKPG